MAKHLKLARAVDVEHHGRHRCAHHPQPDGAAFVQRGQFLSIWAPVRHHGWQIADVRARDRERVAWQLGLVPACRRAEHAVVRWVLNFLHVGFRCVTARPQQAPRCIATGVLWIFATSVSCARFVSPATGARWQSQVLGRPGVQRWLGDGPQPGPSQQHERDDGTADHGARQGDGDNHPAEVDIEHAAPQIEKPPAQ